MIRKFYDWTMQFAGHRHARRGLAGVAFIESSVFPIPPDVLLIPMVIAKPDRAWVYGTICTIASVLGGILGYAIGYFLFEAVGKPILDFYHFGEKFERFTQSYNEWGVWIVAIAGLTPFPFKVITIASGVTKLNLAAFIVTSLFARGARFFLVSALLWKFGEPIRVFVERYLGWLTLLGFVLLLGGFWVIKFF